MPATISVQKRWEIVFLSTHPLGPQLSIAKTAKYTRSSPTIVKFWLKKYKETGGVDKLQHTERPSVISEKQEAIMDTLIAKNPEATSSTIATKLKCKNILVSVRTVRRKLASSGLVFGNTMSKPLLSE
jgi:transposase